MPLFEVVLLDVNGTELRLTDQPADIGDTVQINDEDWIVVRKSPGSARAEARLECERAPAVATRPA